MSRNISKNKRFFLPEKQKKGKQAAEYAAMDCSYNNFKLYCKNNVWSWLGNSSDYCYSRK